MFNQLLPIAFLALNTMAQVTELGGQHRGNFAAISSKPNSASIFSLNEVNQLVQKWNVGDGWLSYWYHHGDYFVGDITGLDYDQSRANIFGRGPKNEAKHYFWNRDSNGQQTWTKEDLGGQFIGDFAAVSLTRNNRERVDLFGRSAINNQILHKIYDGTKWSEWTSIGGLAVSSPTVVSSSNGRLDIFIRGHNNKVYHKSLEGSTWTPSANGWNDLGGDATEEVVAVSNGANNVTIFARDLSNKVNSKFLNGGSNWGPWELQGEGGMYKPAAIAWNDNKVTLAAVSHEGNTLWAKTSTNNQFAPWKQIGGAVAVTGAPQLLWNGADNVYVYTRNADASLAEKKIPQ